MALEQTPPGPVSRARRRRASELGSLLWLCGWGCVTAIALTALAITSQTETAGERLRHIFVASESSAIARMPPRIAHLESETQTLAAQVHALSTERDRLAGRIALLESTIDDITGTIEKQAAATAAALAASASPAAPGGTIGRRLCGRIPRSQMRPSLQRVLRLSQLHDPKTRTRPLSRHHRHRRALRPRL